MSEEEFVKIPHFSRYSISKNGTVIEDVKHQIVVPTYNRYGLPIVALKNERNNLCNMSIAKLVLLTYNPLVNNNYPYVTISYVDKNIKNIVLDNLEWNFVIYKPQFIPGINIRNDEFVTVYGTTDYMINAFGILLNKKGKQLTGHTDSSGYIKTEIDGAGTTSIHRLVALTFLEHPIDTTDLIINHKDGNTSNNYYKNLEWCSYTNNIDHAYDNKMRSQNIPILAMDIETREIVSHYSLRDFCYNVEIPHIAIWWRLRNNRNITPYHGFYIKYTTDLRPWPKKDGVVNVYEKKKILIKNMSSGDVTIFTSYNEITRQYKFQKNSILYQLNKPEPEPYHGLLIKFENDKPWPLYSEQDLHKYSLKKMPQSKPISVYNTQTQETKTYEGIREFCRDINYKAEMFIREKVKSNKPFKHYEINYL